MEEYKKNINIKFILPLVVVVSLLLAFAITYFGNKNEMKINKAIDYLIPGVPYFGVHNHKGTARFIGKYNGGDSCASFASILTYWEPQEINLGTCNAIKKDGDGLLSSKSLINAFESKGLEAKEITVKLEELGRYVNSESKTPLIFSLPVSENQPIESGYNPARVLIGIKYSEKKLIFHDYWLGNNFELTFDEYNKLENKINPEGINKFIVVQPKKLGDKLKEISVRKSSPYPQRTSIMQKGEIMFKDYAIGAAWASRFNYWPQAIEYMTKVKDSPDFEEFFPPYFKLTTFYQLSKAYLEKDDLENSLLYAQKAMDLNHDLDKPFKDWPGFDVDAPDSGTPGMVSGPITRLGDVYKAKGELGKALENYKKALELWPSSEIFKNGVSKIELEMAGTKK